MVRFKLPFKMDPRLGVALITFSNIIAFSQTSFHFQVLWIAVLFLLYVVCGRFLSGLKWLVSYAAMYVIQYFVLPAAPGILSTFFAVFINYSIRMFACLMIGALLIRSVTMREFIAAIRKLRLPQSLIISLSVAIRYFPAIKEESCHIRDAISLREIHGMQKLEAFIVPFMMSAANTAEELSEAVVTRGIENPSRKTGTVNPVMKKLDWLWMIIGTGFAVTAIFIKGNAA